MFRSLLFLAAFSPLALLADLRLEFEVTQTTDTLANEAKHTGPTHSEKKFPATVILGAGYFDFTGNERPRFIDFATKQTYWINPAEKSYQVFSLYSDIGFRTYEFENRLMLGKMLSAGVVKDNPMDPVLVEHALSLRNSNATPLKASDPFPNANYSHAGKPFFSCLGKGRELSEQEAAYFVRFLRYEYAMHPDILTGLQAQRMVPKVFDLYTYNFGAEHYHFTLLRAAEVERGATAAQAVAGLNRETGEVERFCELAAHMSPEDFTARCEQTRQQAITAAKEKRFLDSVLHFVEYNLCTGQPLPKEFSEYKDAIQADPDAQVLFASLKPPTKEAAEKAVEALRQLEAKSTEASYVMKIFVANNLTALGKPAEARHLFQEALRNNPCIVGAWKDLGDIFYGRYEATSAWNCWDAGRHMLSTHPLFRPVDEFELKLRTEHPEFF